MRQDRHIVTAAAALVLWAALSGCTSDDPPKRVAHEAKSVDCAKEENKTHEDCGGPEALPGLGTQLDDVTPLSDDEAIAFIKDKCASCHDSKEGSVKSFWELDQESFTKESFSTSSMAPTVYYALVMRHKNIVGGKPAAMPPNKLKPDQQEKLKSLVRWIEVEMPAVITQAVAMYGGGAGGEGVGVKLNFRCDDPASFREYIRRVTNDAFGREPKVEELELGSSGPDGVTKKADREAIAARLFENKEWRKEFLNVGLKKFAHKVSGANDIGPIEGLLTEEEAKDLQD
jgi:hypothetical protein